MKSYKIFFLVMVVLLSIPSIIVAGDFDWIKDFNITAQADPSGFKAQLSTRFQIGDAKINAVIGNVEKPADAYMVLRLGEIAKRPPEEVLNDYKASKGKGWGVLAKNLGIKPGSREFKALKSGHDLSEQGKEKEEKGKGKGKSRH
jgi:hypothetical protein